MFFEQSSSQASLLRKVSHWSVALECGLAAQAQYLKVYTILDHPVSFLDEFDELHCLLNTFLVFFHHEIGGVESDSFRSHACDYPQNAIAWITTLEYTAAHIESSNCLQSSLVLD